MRLPVDTTTVKLADAEPVLDCETRTPKMHEKDVALRNVPLSAAGTGIKDSITVKVAEEPKAPVRGRTQDQQIKFDRALTIGETADVLGVSYATARRLLLEGKISFQQVSPRRIVVRESALLAYLSTATRNAQEFENSSI